MRENSKLLDELNKVVAQQFGDDFVVDKIDSVEINEDEGTIRFELCIIRNTTSPNSSQIADKLFRLTGAVRRGLSPEWSAFFPVITPVVPDRACA